MPRGGLSLLPPPPPSHHVLRRRRDHWAPGQLQDSPEHSVIPGNPKLRLPLNTCLEGSGGNPWTQVGRPEGWGLRELPVNGSGAQGPGPLELGGSGVPLGGHLRGV